MVRSTVIDLYITDQELRQKIINSVRQYRAACRTLYSMLIMAKLSNSHVDTTNGVTITENEGSNDFLRAICKLPLRTVSREELCPTFQSILLDQIRNDVDIVYKSKDPKITKAKRGWLALQGSRGLASFMGIGLYLHNTASCPKLEKHQLTVTWDKTLGPVTFNIGKLDGGRYYIWKSLKEKTEGWKLGAMRILERDGKLRLWISYYQPDKEKTVDQEKVAIVEFTNDKENFITIYQSDYKMGHADKLSAVEAVGWMEKLDLLRQKFSGRMAAIGSPRRKWGSKKLHDRSKQCLNNVTEKRKNGQKYRNHLWTRRVVSFCERYELGSIKLVNVPDSELFGHPWSWYQFEQMLKYKISEIGGCDKIVKVAVEKSAVA